jgi:hypothetical protein
MNYTSGLALKAEAAEQLPPSSLHLAGAHYKLSIALDLTEGRLADAIHHTQCTLENVEARFVELHPSSRAPEGVRHSARTASQSSARCANSGSDSPPSRRSALIVGRLPSTRPTVTSSRPCRSCRRGLGNGSSLPAMQQELQDSDLLVSDLTSMAVN